MKYVVACDIGAPFGDATFFVLTRIDRYGDAHVIKYYHRLPWWLRAAIHLRLVTAIAETNDHSTAAIRAWSDYRD